MITRLQLPRVPARRRHPTRVRCETDGWTFDPRYTSGRCPICGWAPEGVPNAPYWLALVNRMDWEIIGLFAFADLLVFAGLLVANAAGLLPVGHGHLGLPSSPGGAASAARLH